MGLVELVTSDVEQVVKQFQQFHHRFSHHFATQTRTMAAEAKQYLHGQLICQRRGNLMQFEKLVEESHQQSLHHFIANSPWEETDLLKDVSQSVTQQIGDTKQGSIHIDESGFPKNGNYSVGVARQYCGCLGKRNNCQVGVFLGYAQDTYRILLDKRLYLPKEWIEDPERLKKCGVPADVVFRTKAELGLEMIQHAHEQGLPYAWIGMDCHYGQQPWLLKKLETDSQIYIADIPAETRVFVDCPLTGIPSRRGNRGRQPTKEKVLSEQDRPVTVSQMVQHVDESQWALIYVRETERGALWTRLAVLRVYPVRDDLPGPATWLIFRKDEDKSEIKYQFSNTPIDTTFERLAQMSHSRYWMERAIEDAKSEVGLDEYEVRGWRGWHHHITLTLLAMLFLLELQLALQPKAPHLTLCDVREILEIVLPKRRFTPKDTENSAER